MKMDFKLKGTRMGLKMQAYGIWEKWGAHYSHPYLRMKRALGGGRYPFNGWSPLQPHCQRPSNYCAPYVASRHLFTSIQLPIYTQKSHFKHFCRCLYWVVLLYQGEFNSLFCTILCTQDNYSLMDQALMLDHRCFARRIRRNKWTPLTTCETMIGRTMQAS